MFIKAIASHWGDLACDDDHADTAGVHNSLSIASVDGGEEAVETTEVGIKAEPEAMQVPTVASSGIFYFQGDVHHQGQLAKPTDGTEGGGAEAC